MLSAELEWITRKLTEIQSFTILGTTGATGTSLSGPPWPVIAAHLNEDESIRDHYETLGEKKYRRHTVIAKRVESDIPILNH